MSRPKRGSPGSLATVPYREFALALRTQSLRAIARHYGVQRNAVRYWRLKLGIPGPLRPRGLAPAQVLAALHAQPAGLTTAAVAQACGVSASTSYRLLRRLEDAGEVTRVFAPIPTRPWQTRGWWLAEQGSREVGSSQ